jgi:hypothetical protein
MTALFLLWIGLTLIATVAILGACALNAERREGRARTPLRATDKPGGQRSDRPTTKPLRPELAILMVKSVLLPVHPVHPVQKNLELTAAQKQRCLQSCQEYWGDE